MFDEDMRLTPEEREEAIAAILRTNKHFDEMTPEAKNRAINAAASMNRRNKARLQIIAEAEARERASRAKPRRGRPKIKCEKTYTTTIEDEAAAETMLAIMLRAKNIQNWANMIIREKLNAGEELPDGTHLRSLTEQEQYAYILRDCDMMPSKKMVGTILWTVAPKWAAYKELVQNHQNKPAMLQMFAEEPRDIPEDELPELAFRAGLCGVYNDKITFPMGVPELNITTEVPRALQTDPQFSIGRVVLKHMGGNTYQATVTYVFCF